MDDFDDPGAFEADPDVDLDEDMDQDALDLGEYEADGGEEELDEHDDDDGAGMPFDPIALGLKEINNLARCRVSTFKPGNGVKELLDDDLGQYWQCVSLNRPRLIALSPHSHSTPTCSNINIMPSLLKSNSKFLLTSPQDLTASSLTS